MDTHKLRLLLVDDHADSMRVLQRLLEMEGYDVQSASNVAEAVALASSHPFDLVISDLGLPDGSGLELMRELRKRHGLSGIALTGSDDTETVSRSRAAGIRQLLVKPIDLPKLHSAIEHATGVLTH